jgi:hypothetical protein
VPLACKRTLKWLWRGRAALRGRKSPTRPQCRIQREGFSNTTQVVSNAAAPFGGVKQSASGREGGLEGIEEYLYTQYIGIADPYTA